MVGQENLERTEKLGKKSEKCQKKKVNWLDQQS